MSQPAVVATFLVKIYLQDSHYIYYMHVYFKLHIKHCHRTLYNRLAEVQNRRWSYLTSYTKLPNREVETIDKLRQVSKYKNMHLRIKFTKLTYLSSIATTDSIK